jgi:hypothetical protein
MRVLVGVVLRIARCAHTDEMPLGNGADVGFSTDGSVRVERRDPLPGQQVVGGDAKRSAELEQTVCRRSGLVTPESCFLLSRTVVADGGSSTPRFPA